MDLLTLVAYILSILIGISIGLIGAGGSILTIPILVYVLGINPILAVNYSFLIVGTTSLIGGIKKYRQKEVDLKIAFLFGVSSIIAVYLTRHFIIGAIPSQIFGLAKEKFLMGLFALLMAAAAQAMISDKKINPAETKINLFKIYYKGAFTGMITGLIGVGGGFLITPLLVISAGLTVKKAIGTSLLIITANSFVGYASSIHPEISWVLVFSITTLSTFGMIFGNWLNQKIKESTLKKLFGYLILLVATMIIMKEFFL